MIKKEIHFKKGKVLKMEIEQVSIFDLSREDDPLYIKLKQLKSGGEVIISNIVVSLNSHGLYEINDDDNHDSASSLDKCYCKVSLLVKKIDNETHSQFLKIEEKDIS